MKHLIGRVTRRLSVAAIFIIGLLIEMAQPAHAAGVPSEGGWMQPVTPGLLIVGGALGVVVVAAIAITAIINR